MTTSNVRKLLFASLLVFPLVLANGSNPGRSRTADDEDVPTRHNEATVAQLQKEMASGELTSEELTREYIQRIIALDQNGPGLNSVIELNPDALALARQADEMRRRGHVLGPLHGIPILLKDNIDTGDRMQTTAGSFALFGMPALQDSTVAANLRKGGAIILGKTNLSEWANWRSFESTSGWSGRGGQTNNPYGINRNPCGSSSGSAAAVSANLTAVSLGTETDGSVVCPANVSGVVGIKPTVGLTSRAGVVPISHTQDTVGVHARTVADAAAVLGVIQSRNFDGRDPATGGVPLGAQGVITRPTNIPTDYTQFVDAHGLQGKTIGVFKNGFFSGLPIQIQTQVQALWDQSLAAIQGAGATTVDLDAAGFSFQGGNGELLVLCFDFRNDVKNYFATRMGVPVAGKTLTDAIAFNNAHADVEMPFFNQDIWTLCNGMAPGPDDPQPSFVPFTNPPGDTTPISYNQALKADQLAATGGIDAALKMFHLDALVMPTDNPAWSTDLLFGDRFFFGTSGFAGPPGYPIVQVPIGEIEGLPMGISFFGTAFSEPTLIRLASGFEAVTNARANNLPTLALTAPFDHIKGTTLLPPNERAARSGITTPAQSAITPKSMQSQAPKKAPDGWRPHHM